MLAPGWSSYRHRLRYHTYDVTDLISDGPNAIGATVADGWFRGLLGFEGGKRNIYGNRLALLAQLEIHYIDGSVQTITSDDGWRAGSGPIRPAGIYGGETYDARRELPGWSSPGFDDGTWSTVVAQRTGDRPSWSRRPGRPSAGSRRSRPSRCSRRSAGGRSSISGRTSWAGFGSGSAAPLAR